MSLECTEEVIEGTSDSIVSIAVDENSIGVVDNSDGKKLGTLLSGVFDIVSIADSVVCVAMDVYTVGAVDDPGGETLELVSFGVSKFSSGTHETTVSSKSVPVGTSVIQQGSSILPWTLNESLSVRLPNLLLTMALLMSFLAFLKTVRTIDVLGSSIT